MDRRPLHIVHTESSCGWGGQEIRILTEAQGLQKRGHRLSLLTPEGACIAESARQRGITVVEIPIGKKRLSGWFEMTAWLQRHKKNIDIINTHSSTDTWLTALAAQLIPGTPPILRTRHVSSPVNRSRQTAWLYQKAVCHVVVTGEAIRQQLHRDNGFALESMTSVPTGIDLDYFSPLPSEQGKTEQRDKLGLPAGPIVGIVATLRNWKGHAYLLEAFAALAHSFPDWTLLVVGDGPQRANLERNAAELEVKHRITFVGNRNDVPELLRAMDIFVLPSYGDEGVPQGIMQAMACGLPVISTPVGAIGEAVDNGNTGILVTPKDSHVLADALAGLMADERCRMDFGAAGLIRARQRFGIELMLDRMEFLFHTYARGAG